MARIMIAAPSSGSGKTTVVCGLLQSFLQKGVEIAALKCGPDYIDPMFHRVVLGARSGNIDTFFTDAAKTRELLSSCENKSGLTLIEGVMGFMDGIGFEKEGSSAYLAELTGTPVVLVVNVKGMSRSAAAYIRGFLTPEVKGVILNRISRSFYPAMKRFLEDELGITVFGYMEDQCPLVLESRHLGLVMPDEIADLKEKLNMLADYMQEHIDLDAVLRCANAAERLSAGNHEKRTVPALYSGLKIGIASDPAFCFYYEENKHMLEEAGAELVPFSPITDTELPDEISGIYLGGGYPEFYLKELSENDAMRCSILSAHQRGMPILAECGGFLYLHETMYDKEGIPWSVAGIIKGSAAYEEKMRGFGYISLKEGRFFGKEIGEIRAHEFHYYQSDHPGASFLAEKPTGKRSWRCIHSRDILFAGFPHLYFPANPKLADCFLDVCHAYQVSRQQEGGRDHAD